MCLDIFPATLLLNQNIFYEKRSHLDKSLKQKSRVPKIILKISETNLNSKKNPIIFMREKYVRVCFSLSHLPVSEFLLFHVLFWSSINKSKSRGPRFCGPESRIYGSWVLSPGFQILGPGILSPHFRLCQ